MSPRLGEFDYDAMFDAYVEAALWSTNDDISEDGGEPLDANYDRTNIDPKTLRVMKEDCRAFVEGVSIDDINLYFAAMAHVAEGPEAQMGHDFWLTRNHHGVGFWDREQLKIAARPINNMSLGERLAHHARVAGEVNLYVGDDKVIYQSGAEPERVLDHEDAILGLDDRSTATILAALRMWQRASGCASSYELDIATDAGKYSRLNCDQIDELCERLNCDRIAMAITKA